MKYRNRALALLLSMVMVLTFMPAIAFAEAEDEAQAPASEAAEVETPAEAEAPADVEEPAEEAPAEAEAPANAEAPADVEEAAAKEPKAAPAKAPQAKNGNRDGQEYSLIWDPNGGYFYVPDENGNSVKNYLPITQGCMEGENQITPESVYRRGYTHIGWSKEQNGGTIIDFSAEPYNVTKNETFYAQWSENPKATFNFSGGFVWVWDDETNESSKVYDTYVAPTYQANEGTYYIEDPGEAEKPGYNFVGWTDEDGKPVESIGNCEITEDVTFYAQWERNNEQILVTFDAVDGTYDDGSHTKEIAVWKNGDEEAWIDSEYYYEPRKTGFVLSYWTDESGKKYNQDDFDEGFTIKKDTTFTANYEEGYKVTFKPDREGVRKFVKQGEVINDYETYVRKNSQIGSIPEFDSEDGTESVVGWEDESGNKIDLDEYKVTANNTVLYAIWGKTVRVVLHGNGGLFDNDIPTQDLFLRQNSDFEYAARFISGGIQIAPIDMTQPHLDGSVFTGWYTDENCTQLFVQEKATEEYINSLDNATLDLYAGFTKTQDDYSTVTIHANGGTLNREQEGAESTTLLVPNGTAFRFYEEVYKENEEGEYCRLLGVYSDEGLTNKVDLVGDGYYVANGDTDLYPAWGEPLPDLYMELDSEYEDFYLDGNKKLDVIVENHNGSGTNGLLRKCRINVYDTSQGAGDLDLLTPIAVLEGSDYTKWVVDRVEDGREEGTITLYGKKVQTALSNLLVAYDDLTYDDLTLVVIAEITTESGEEVAKQDRTVHPKLACYDYRFDEVFGEFNEERDTFTPAVGKKFELLLGNGSEWTGKYIEFWHEGVHYWSGEPDGDWFNYEITGITSSKTGVVKVTKEEDGFYLSPVSLGTANITVNYKDENGKAQTPVVYTASVVNNKYYVWFNDNEHYDEGEEIVVMKTVPGGSAVFTAKGSRVDTRGTHNDGFTYNWSFVDAFAANLATIDANNATATVNVNEDADLDNEDLKKGIKVKVEVVDANGQAKASDTAILYVVKEFYEITNLPKIDPWMRKGQTVKFDPEVRHYSSETKDKPGGYEVSAKPIKLNFFDGNDDDDEDYDGNSVQAIEITAAGKAVKDGDEVSGPFTVKRIADAEAYLHLRVYCNSNNDEDYDDEDYSTARRNVYLEEIFNIKNAKVVGIKTQTYSGKARKPVPSEVSVRDSEGDYRDAWRGDGDYTITYKNNIKVGKASLIITGHNRFYGTKTVSFNINPKKAVVEKATPGKKKLTVKAKTKVSSTGGTTYQVWYRVKGKSSWKKKTTKNQKLVIKKLKKGKKYQVKIRAIKKVGKTTYYGSWSKTKTTGKIK